MATKNTKRTPPPAFRVFVSSTYVDMLPYRDAIRNALNKADCVPFGMERFGAAAVSPLEMCYEELGNSQIYLCALGMKYGSIDENTQKSYTQLEYEKAQELGIPILAFLVDEDNMEFKSKDIDKGESYQKLEQFKRTVKDSKEVTCSFFDSPMSLQEAVYRSVIGEMKRQGNDFVTATAVDDQYIEGANVYNRFVKRPERYKNKEVTLRVRMDGLYGGWRLRDEVLKGFGMIPGDTLYLNNIFVQGVSNIDVAQNVWYVDGLAEGDAADWLDDNLVTTGTVFEGKFKLAYELIRKANRQIDGAEDAKIASIILLKGIRIVSRGLPISICGEDE